MLLESSCGAVVFVRNLNLNYLLLHYREGHWGFVKGNVEFNETEKETVIRELEEETGIRDAKFIDSFREKIKYIYVRNGQSVSKQVIFFLIEARTNKIRISSEHSDFLWMPYMDAINRITFNNSRKVLKKAASFLKIKTSL